MNLAQQIFPIQVFRAYDIRGKVSMLTPECIYAVACGLAEQFIEHGQKKIALGYDARLTSAEYAEIIQHVCTQKGLEVTLIGQCSSPMLYFIAGQNDGNGIMVTASHNPKTDNGIKWVLNGLPPTPEMIQDIAKKAQNHFQTSNYKIRNEAKAEHIAKFCLAYQKYLISDIHLKNKFKVVIDGLNGSAGECAAHILENLGCNVVALRCHADGHFPDHAPDPSKEQHLEKLKVAVIEHGADIGIALDGDGDRLVLVDEKAKALSADQLLSLFSEICLKSHPNSEVVYDVKCSTMVRNTIRHLGGQAKMIRTGSTFLRTYLANSNGHAIFGGEYAGHYVFNDARGLGYDDGLYAALRVLEYLSESGFKTVSELFAKYPARFSTEDTYISTHDVEPSQVLQYFEKQSLNLNAELSKIDGIRLDFKDGFGIIRASNTGEYFTVRFDADSSARLNEIRNTFVNMLSDRYSKIAQDILDAQ
ncbi:phosphomannomutase [Acinetobacter sp. Ac_877]|uniref:phosphomannomutase/phosphoglucomutase n=1 Tax=Acinetobacter portensis TaxID=1839785 RepID=UPI00128DD9CE|nr:phosphomannomutase/phosphoglucomutase [Acinetobacter portensis]MPW41327.1 phosphomannomutase [Acinetobacter portensis]